MNPVKRTPIDRQPPPRKAFSPGIRWRGSGPRLHSREQVGLRPRPERRPPGLPERFARQRPFRIGTIEPDPIDGEVLGAVGPQGLGLSARPGLDIDQKIDSRPVAQGRSGPDLLGPKRGRPQQPGHPVGLTGLRQPAGVGSRRDGVRGEPADGDMVGVQVEAAGVEGDDQSGPVAAQQRDELAADSPPGRQRTASCPGIPEDGESRFPEDPPPGAARFLSPGAALFSNRREDLPPFRHPPGWRWPAPAGLPGRRTCRPHPATMKLSSSGWARLKRMVGRLGIGGSF